MRTARRKLPARLKTRTCLSCGYDGPSLQGRRGHVTVSCPCCGQDLYARPPLSYAEMEGLRTKRRLRMKLRRTKRSRPRKHNRPRRFTGPIRKFIGLLRRAVGR